ncbi:MAG: PxKF domain-containing protein [bacterium]|nr:PxKF domain-containing protein [bacterium]
MKLARIIVFSSTLALAAAFPLSAAATTYFSGTIEGDVTWTKEAGPYVVGSVTIPSGSSLTILPGTVVKMRPAAEGGTILVQGALTVCSPESNEPVIFTSIKDDTVGGDTNGDGDATIPRPGDWRSVTVEPGGTTSIARAVFRFGGAYTGYDRRCIGPCGYGYFAESQLFNHGGTLTVDASSFEHTLSTHIEQSAGTTTITGSDLIGAPLALKSASGSLTLSRNHFFSNTRGFNVTRTALSLASNIFIATPMNDLDLNADYSSDGMNMAAGTSATALRVSGVIDGRSLTLPRDGFVYVLAGVQIAPLGALTISPGAIVKMHPGILLTISGSLTIGDSASPLSTLVTSFRDDEWGGDTNGDGSVTGPAQGDWTNITVESGGTVSVGKTAFRYGGAYVGYERSCAALCGYRYSTESQLFNHGGTLVVNGGRFSFAQSSIDTRGGETTVAATDLTGTTLGALTLTLGTLVMEGSSVHDIVSGTAGLNIWGSGIKTANVIGNWWGSATGPTHYQNASGTGAIIDGEAEYTPWLTEPPDLEEPVFIAPATTTIPARLCTENCVEECANGSTGSPQGCNSNVLFLPGIEASRLYRPDYDGGTDQLWEPNAQSDVTDIFLTDEGKSVRSDIYTKDVVDEINVLPIGQANIYKSFLADLDAWKNEDHLIADYAAIPYDWRLSLDDILESGNDINGRIYYSGDNAATTTPFILQELRRLAASSRTGKVTVIAHSNGGLLAKALIKKLGDVEAAKLIDKIIFVAVPQLGIPQAIGALLHGYDQGLPKDWFPIILTPRTARAFASTSPMAYHLLPSAAYFGGEGAAVRTPLVTFDDGSLTQPFIDAYGHAIGNPAELHNFLIGSEGRVAPDPSDIKSPSILHSALLSSGENVHQDLDDNWSSPASIAIHQIAGWGEDTLGGIRYWTGEECVYVAGRCASYRPKLEFTPQEVIDGDGTVVVPSALAMSTSTTNVSRWWVNLFNYNDINFDREHADILEVLQLRGLIKNIFTTGDTSSPLQFISTSTPQIDSAPRLLYFLHSPLALSAHDGAGNEISAATSTIPGARYKLFGEVQYISLPASVHPTILLTGLAEGSFTLEIQEVAGDIVIATTTFVGIPTSTSTIATMDFTDGTIANAGALTVDADGNGTTDFSLAPKLNDTVMLPPSPPPYRFGGFLQPINDTAYNASQSLSVFKGGSTIPVKFQLKNASGVPIQASTSPMWLTPQKGTPMNAPLDESSYADLATSSTTFRYDLIDQQYIYNWSTKGFPAGYWYRIYVKLDDGTTQSVMVGLR